MDKKIYAYFHAGSKNHGCEAIVRATQAILDEKMTLVSSAPEEDKLYQIDGLVNLQGRKRTEYSVLEKVINIITERIFKSEVYSYNVASKHECDSYAGPGIALSIGGDNYCYGEAYNLHLAGMNRYLQRRGLKTVLWGCSVEPKDVTPAMQRDFARYDLITARETISYDFLKKYNPNTVLVCDPAFLLEKEELPLPRGFVEGKTVGINISPLIQKSEKISGITMQNYLNMVDHILKTTDYQIALIPHVVCDGNDDRIPLREIYNTFAETGRLVMIEDCNCKQLKGYISRCKMFIGARTHATIAAYSTGVPTLVIGYSTKAIGIAKDLFGTSENYVLPVQSLSNLGDMVKAFDWLNTNKEQIHTHLQEVMPEYRARMVAGVNALKAL